MNATPAADAPHQRAPRVSSVDILRGIAILWVIAFHLSADVGNFDPIDSYYTDVSGAAGALDLPGFFGALWRLALRSGYQGVPLFFMASGFAMTYNSILRGSTVPSLLSGLPRRMKALLLPYWLSLALTTGVIALLALVRNAVDGGGFVSQFTDRTMFLGAPYPLGREDWIAGASVVARLFDSRWLFVPSPSLWFVIVFVQFYLAFPLLFPALRRLGAWPFLALTLVITLVAKAPITLSDRGYGLLFNWWIDSVYLPMNLFTFGLGMSLAWLYVYDRDALRRYTSKPLDWALLIYGGLMVHTGGALLQGRAGIVGVLSAPMVVLGLTIVVLPWIANADEARADSALRARLAAIGVMSYSLLIASDPFRFVLGTMYGLDAPTWAWAILWAVYLPLLLGLALVVERVTQAMVSFRVTRPRPPAHVAVAAGEQPRVVR